MTSEYDIQFDGNSSRVFFAGQTMTGSVELNLALVKNITGVFIHITGYCEVNWTEKSGNNDSGIEHYKGREQYLDETLYLAGTKDGPAFELPPGRHSYPFSFHLPQTLASSVEGKWGRVRYSVKLTMARPWMADNTQEVFFTVLRHLDLNDNSLGIRKPLKVVENKIFCCWPCSSDPLFIAAEIPISGYVPGQTVAIKYDVHNQSSKRVYTLKANLVRTDVFKSEHPRTKHRSNEGVMDTVTNDGLGPRQRATFEQFLKIHSCPPTTLTSSLITITYAIELDIGVSGLSRNLKLYFPITIGTIPLANTAVPGYQSVSDVSPVATQPMSFSPSAPDMSSFAPTAPLLSHQYPEDLPPPTFEEAMQAVSVIKQKQQEEEVPAIGWINFNPKYMVYRFDGYSSGAAPNLAHPIEYPMKKA
ncbi:arrestin domain-containing protein 2-like [Uranotaenia lowii]|uniref:arrestin domain-containing protein 2-like n=1 Tax=Uranotaenia lowii TaxID=190385 RepID=UPI00247A2DD3|nr:arrestin domain-containing protein 2-like [Uranotaenia lowii]